MKARRCIFLFSLATVFFYNSHTAQADTAVSPEIYKSLEQKLFIDETLKNRGPAQFSREELKDLIFQAASIGTIPQIGTISESEAGYSARTGLSGTARGQVRLAEYEISVEPINGIQVQMSHYYVIPGVDQELAIGLYEQKGGALNFSKTAKNWREKLQQMWEFFRKDYLAKIPFAGKYFNKTISSRQISVTVPFSLRLYKDGNANGRQDPGEQPVEWANVKVNLRKVSKESEMVFSSGINSFTFKKKYKNVPSAMELLKQLSLINYQDMTLFAIEGGITKTLILKQGSLFGEDFLLNKSTQYEIDLAEPAKLVLVE